MLIWLSSNIVILQIPLFLKPFLKYGTLNKIWSQINFIICKLIRFWNWLQYFQYTSGSIHSTYICHAMILKREMKEENKENQENQNFQSTFNFYDHDIDLQLNPALNKMVLFFLFILYRTVLNKRSNFQ